MPGINAGTSLFQLVLFNNLVEDKWSGFPKVTLFQSQNCYSDLCHFKVCLRFVYICIVWCSRSMKSTEGPLKWEAEWAQIICSLNCLYCWVSVEILGLPTVIKIRQLIKTTGKWICLQGNLGQKRWNFLPKVNGKDKIKRRQTRALVFGEHLYVGKFISVDAVDTGVSVTVHSCLSH